MVDMFSLFTSHLSDSFEYRVLE
uniref:Uncharacterized protein n=1 Tax=Anguilla anguilla TaxID=7936 RepID=A0A0E9P753_ANGAN